MLVTNQTNQDYWFGPLHLGAGVGTTLTVDDTSATSLYLTSDTVADAINNLYHSGKITVSSAASPFPRPTGVPQLLHGDGSPEGLVYAAQGSLYMRRDNTGSTSSLYSKTTGVTINTGWLAFGASTEVAPIGCIQVYAAAAAPTGWLLCNGAAVSRSTYSGLFGVISTTYGAGDGSTTFNVPDLRGRVIAGYAASGGHSDVSTLGNNDAVAVANRRPKHNHTVTNPTISAPTITHAVKDASSGAGANTGFWATSASGASNTGGFSASAPVASGGAAGVGGTAAVDAPAYLVLNHIIKT